MFLMFYLVKLSNRKLTCMLGLKIMLKSISVIQFRHNLLNRILRQEQRLYGQKA